MTFDEKLFLGLKQIAEILGIIFFGLVGLGAMFCLFIGIVFVLMTWRDYK